MPLISKEIRAEFEEALLNTPLGTPNHNPEQRQIVRELEIPIGTRNKLTVEKLLNMSRRELRRELVIMENTEKGVFITITGMQDTGKSHLAASIFFDHMIRRQGVHGMIIDPAREYETRQKFTKNPATWNLWTSLDLLPRYNLSLAPHTPYVCATDPKREKAYQIDPERISVHDLFTLLDLWGKKNAPQRRRLRAAIREYRRARGMSEGIQLLSTPCPPARELINFLSLGAAGPTDVVIEMIENLADEGTIGTRFPNPSFSLELLEGKTPCIRTTIDKRMYGKMAGIIELAIWDIINKRIQGGADIERTPVQILIDEYNVVANEKNFEFFSNIYDQMRKFGIGLLGIAPSPRDLHVTAIKQSDYWICGKIMSRSAEAEDIRQRLGTWVDPDILTELRDPGKGKYPKQFALINREGEVRTFYPLPTLSQPFKRKKAPISLPKATEPPSKAPTPEETKPTEKPATTKPSPKSSPTKPGSPKTRESKWLQASPELPERLTPAVEAIYELIPELPPGKKGSRVGKSVPELARERGRTIPVVWRMIGKLAKLGLVRRFRRGNSYYYVRTPKEQEKPKKPKNKK